MKSERGNILFLILLAIILFAALAYAVNSGMRGGGNSAAKESAQSGAAAMLQYMTLVRTTVQRLMLVNGCEYNNLDFRNTFYTRVGGGAMASTGQPLAPKAGCAVFQEYGGPIAPQSFEKYEQQGYTAYMQANTPSAWNAGNFVFRWMSRINEGTDATDFGMEMDGISFEACMYMLNIHNPLPVSSIPTEGWEDGGQQNVAPTVITGTDRIGDDPLNIGGDVFMRKVNSGVPHCRVGMILVSR